MYSNHEFRNRRKVWWKPGETIHNPKKLNPVTWKIFCQDNVAILPGKSVLLALSFGVKMSEGAVLVSLDQELKISKCSIQNEVILEDTSDITIIIQNNSVNTAISISPGQDLCLLRYV